MKRIYLFILLLLTIICLTGCDKKTLNKLLNDEKIINIDVTSQTIEIVNDLKIEELKGKDFFINIMNSQIKKVKEHHDVDPEWNLHLHTKNNVLEIQYLNGLYARYNNKHYLINCSTNDIKSIDDYITAKQKFKLIIENETPFKLEDLKGEYLANEEIELKVLYNRPQIQYYIKEDVYIHLYVFLNGKLIGELTEEKTLKFKMPKEDSVLIISQTNENIYKLEVTDNFNLLSEPLKHYYKAGEKVVVITKFLSGPRTDVELNGELLKIIQNSCEVYEYRYEFIMPSFDSKIVLLWNKLTDKP